MWINTFTIYFLYFVKVDLLVWKSPGREKTNNNWTHVQNIDCWYSHFLIQLRWFSVCVIYHKPFNSVHNEQANSTHRKKYWDNSSPHKSYNNQIHYEWVLIVNEKRRATICVNKSFNSLFLWLLRIVRPKFALINHSFYMTCSIPQEKFNDWEHHLDPVNFNYERSDLCKEIISEIWVDSSKININPFKPIVWEISRSTPTK